MAPYNSALLMGLLAGLLTFGLAACGGDDYTEGGATSNGDTGDSNATSNSTTGDTTGGSTGGTSNGTGATTGGTTGGTTGETTGGTTGATTGSTTGGTTGGTTGSTTGGGDCPGPNPAGCFANGCPDGMVCVDDPINNCVSSSCFCDEESGSWACTDDCNGGVCVPEGDTCDSDADCEAGAEWCEEGGCVECDNSGQLCDLACEDGYTMAERNGCTPCECVPINECESDQDCGRGQTCEPGDMCFAWCPAGDPSCCYGNTCSEPSACEGPSPAGCRENGCPAGQMCSFDTEECTPSSCECDEATGQWACTRDCGGGVCVPEETACEGPNPAGCLQNGCPRGQVCSTDTEECVPSGCSCDEESGGWICTADCGGGVCVPDDGGGACRTDADCESGAEWCEDGRCVECDNSGLQCRIACEEGYELHQRNGCSPCECVPINACEGDDECARGEVCEPGGMCLSWCPEGDPSCCYGNTCVEPSACEGPNPAGCAQNGCPRGEVCSFDTEECVPSSCECDEDSGLWACTRDCGGGVCVPDDGGGVCDTDADCREGAEWCEEGRCVECDNSGQMCRIACQEGYELHQRNGCTPCECVPINECETRFDCNRGELCEPGDMCLSWCPEGDPSCCYGNTCVDPNACEGPNPAGCRELGCPRGQVCSFDEDVCVPSGCFCGDDGSWVCTDDCGGGVCVPEETTCEGPNPAGCAQNGCPRGEVCSFDTEECIPSSCECDEDSGLWACTRDCGGGVCVPDDGGGACRTDSDCESGAEWCEDGRCVECDNSGLLCRIACEEGYELHQRNGCSPCECVPINACEGDDECARGEVCEPGDMCLSWCPEGDPSCCYGNTCVEPSVCEGPNPAGCTRESRCPDGQTCVNDPDQCNPSSCFCSEETGQWICTDDCGGGVCMPEESACEGPNPAGCRETGCPRGQSCSFDTQECIPSSCECDEGSGVWACTRDCNGGVCVPDDGGGACETDAECQSGAEWCEEGSCVECDNSGQVCFILCDEGYELQERNGCTPCACVPINACESDEECVRGLVCEPGPECLSWCPEGDPSCCYGNTCVEPSACEGPNPAGCRQNGCPDGQSCSFDADICVPSSCTCGDDGSWICTDDCGGGVCVGR